MEGTREALSGLRRSTLQRVVEDNIGRIDRLDIDIFDDKGNVIGNESRVLFQLEGLEKSQAARGRRED